MNKIKIILISLLLSLFSFSLVIANEFIGVVAVGVGNISNQKNEKLFFHKVNWESRSKY